MEEANKQPEPGFGVDEQLEGFDLGSLVDSQMLLDARENRVCHWDFMQQEQSEYGLGAHVESIPLSEHNGEQDDCRCWPRHPTCEVDAQFLVSSQVDITDTFDAQGRHANSVEKQVGESVSQVEKIVGNVDMDETENSRQADDSLFQVEVMDNVDMGETRNSRQVQQEANRHLQPVLSEGNDSPLSEGNNLPVKDKIHDFISSDTRKIPQDERMGIVKSETFCKDPVVAVRDDVTLDVGGHIHVGVSSVVQMSEGSYPLKQVTGPVSHVHSSEGTYASESHPQVEKLQTQDPQGVNTSIRLESASSLDDLDRRKSVLIAGIEVKDHGVMNLHNVATMLYEGNNEPDDQLKSACRDVGPGSHSDKVNTARSLQGGSMPSGKDSSDELLIKVGSSELENRYENINGSNEMVNQVRIQLTDALHGESCVKSRSEGADVIKDPKSTDTTVGECSFCTPKGSAALDEIVGLKSMDSSAVEASLVARKKPASEEDELVSPRPMDLSAAKTPSKAFEKPALEKEEIVGPKTVEHTAGEASLSVHERPPSEDETVDCKVRDATAGETSKDALEVSDSQEEEIVGMKSIDTTAGEASFVRKEPASQEIVGPESICATDEKACLSLFEKPVMQKNTDAADAHLSSLRNSASSEEDEKQLKKPPVIVGAGTVDQESEMGESCEMIQSKQDTNVSQSTATTSYSLELMTSGTKGIMETTKSESNSIKSINRRARQVDLTSNQVGTSGDGLHKQTSDGVGTKNAPRRRKRTETHDRSQIGNAPYKEMVWVSKTWETNVVDHAITSPFSSHHLAPNLSKEVSPSNLFSEPQQVQLRAQILVYGSLLQGAIPEEILMVTAFADTNGGPGRIIWEKSWRSCVEKIHNRGAESTQRDGVAVANISIPPGGCHDSSALKIQSPLHNGGDPSITALANRSSQPAFLHTTGVLPAVQTWPSLHGIPKQTSMKPFLPDMYIASLMPGSANQVPTTFPGQWIPQAQRTVDTQAALVADIQSSTFSASPAHNATHCRMPSLIPKSILPSVSGSMAPAIGASSTVVKVAAASDGRLLPNNSCTSDWEATSESRPRKRRKYDSDSNVPLTGTVQDSTEGRQTNDIKVTGSNSQMLLSTEPLAMVAMNTKTSTQSLDTLAVAVPSTSYQLLSTIGFTQSDWARELERTKLSTEEASLLADSALKESELMWSQLQDQSSSGLISNTDKQSMASVIAMRAAASVAEAAAAAAKIAFEAALHTKLLADEALKSKEGHDGECHTVNDSAQALNIINTRDPMFDHVKAFSKRRIEEANAAVVRAQNLDSIVRAVELARKAMSHVGAAVVMGDSIPFKVEEMLQAGKDGFCDLLSPGFLKKNQGGNQKPNYLQIADKNSSEGEVKAHMKKRPSKEKDEQSARKLNVDNALIESSEIETAMYNDTQIGKSDQSPVNEISQDSIVEVLSYEEGLRGAWFSARVLCVENEKALVLYDELLSDDGRNLLKEWIELEKGPGSRPRVRLAHPSSSISLSGTRKRRREALGNYVWSVGDRVDVWMRDGWWEGEVRDVSDDGEGKVKVFFPGEGDTELVKASDLRPSLIWCNGKWVLWTDMKCEIGRHLQQHETPQPKRPRVEGGPSNLGVKWPAELNALEKASNLSAIEGKVRKGNGEAGRSEAVNQGAAEGSKVVFGIPKPTKRRKFKEVSKHFTTNQSSFSPHPRNHALKSHKITRSVESGIVSVDEAKSKRRPAFSVHVRSRKESKNIEATDIGSRKVKGKPLSETKHKTGLGSAAGKLEIKTQYKDQPSTLQNPQNLTYDKLRFWPNENTNEMYASRKKVSERLKENKSQLSHSAKKERQKEDSKLAVGPLEPRRSVRKIQPTSKLLEGLQTAPTQSKGSLGSHVQPRCSSMTVKATAPPK